MNKHEHLVADFWNALNSRNWEQAGKLLHEQFKATWPNTGEEFNRKQFILINESYPGEWNISAKRLLSLENETISVVEVANNEQKFFATSFFTFKDNQIISLTEYWGECSPTPQWRQNILKEKSRP